VVEPPDQSRSMLCMGVITQRVSGVMQAVKDGAKEYNHSKGRKNREIGANDYGQSRLLKLMARTG